MALSPGHRAGGVAWEQRFHSPDLSLVYRAELRHDSGYIRTSLALANRTLPVSEVVMHSGIDLPQPLRSRSREHITGGVVAAAMGTMFVAGSILLLSMARATGSTL